MGTCGSHSILASFYVQVSTGSLIVSCPPGSQAEVSHIPKYLSTFQLAVQGDSTWDLRHGKQVLCFPFAKLPSWNKSPAKLS